MIGKKHGSGVALASVRVDSGEDVFLERAYATRMLGGLRDITPLLARVWQ